LEAQARRLRRLKVNEGTESRLARSLLKFECGGFQRPCLKHGAAGMAYFKPGGVSFWDCQRFSLLAWPASRCFSRFFIRFARLDICPP
jgi:hypothetical protein